MQPVNICEVLSDAIHTAKNLAQTKNININIENLGFIKDMQGDYGRLRQMFMVVLDNAIKFSKQNGIVEVVCEYNTISIKDYGCGIKPEDMKFVFERFYKIDNDSNRSGSGLGLAIAKQIAKRHNIDIDVKSEINIGTEFIFIFN